MRSKLAAGQGTPLDMVRARDRYEEACRRGNSASCARAGDISRDGTGGAVVDEDLAIRMYRRGCAAKQPYACSALGGLLAQRTTAPELAEARAALEQACALDEAWACARLAEHLENGTFGAPETFRAKSYRVRACTLGDRDACARRR